MQVQFSEQVTPFWATFTVPHGNAIAFRSKGHIPVFLKLAIMFGMVIA